MLSSSLSRLSLVCKGSGAASTRHGLASLYAASRNASSGSGEDDDVKNKFIKPYLSELQEHLRKHPYTGGHAHMCYEEAMPKEPPVIFRPPDNLEVLISQKEQKPLENFEQEEDFSVPDYLSDYKQYVHHDRRDYMQFPKKSYQYYDEEGKLQETNSPQEAKEKSYRKPGWKK